MEKQIRESIIKCLGHFQKRVCEYINRRMLRLELPGRRDRRRPKKRFLDVVREDMKVDGAREEGAVNRVRCKKIIICCGDL